MPNIKITKTFVDTVKPPKEGQIIYTDTLLQGFGLRVTPKKKTFIVNKQVNNKQHRVTIGTYNPMSVEQARKEATQILAKLDSGDVVQPRRDKTEYHFLTVEQVFQDYIRTKDLKKKTITGYQSIMNTGLSQWNSKRLIDINREMVKELHVKLSKTKKAIANNTTKLLGYLYTFAKANYRTDSEEVIFEKNPVEVISDLKLWNKISRRTSVITAEELPKWYRALFEVESTDYDNHDVTRDYIILILFTGLRRKEASSITWEQVDFERKWLTITDTKNGNPLILPLPDVVMELFEQRRKKNLKKGKYVFPDYYNRTYAKEPRTFIERVTEISGIEFTIHDLRRTFSTIVESMDISQYSIKRLLNHSMDSDVTAGYIIDNVERLRDPLKRIEQKIIRLCNI